MNPDALLSRRSVLLGAAGTAAAGVVGSTAPTVADTGPAAPPDTPLWREAWRNGIVFGSSTATWQISDKEYARVFDHEAAMLFTEDDLLWYRLKPKPNARLDFS